MRNLPWHNFLKRPKINKHKLIQLLTAEETNTFIS